MPPYTGQQIWSDELANGVTGKVQVGGQALSGQGYIVGIMAAGGSGQVIRLRDTDASGDVIYVGTCPFFGSPQGDGPWIPRDSWIPYTDGVWVQTNTVSSGLFLIVQPAHVTGQS